jgi:hypothetical protein
MNILWSIKHTVQAKISKGLNLSDILTSIHSRKKVFFMLTPSLR